MKYLLSLIFLFAFGVSGFSQSNFSAVMSDTNGSIQRPTNFWTANSNSINSIVSNASTFGGINLVYKIQQAFFANQTIEQVNSSVSITNAAAILSIASTNTNAIASTRLIGRVNSESSQGSGTLFGNDSHVIWTRFEASPRENGLMRMVLGNFTSRDTNIAEYPTNRAVGFELRRLSGDTNEVRLIAHNGTTNTNGPWVAVATVFRRQTIGVEQNKTNGQVRLWVGESASLPTINTNATISGGPTNNAGGLQSALEVGLFTTNTNAGSIGVNVFSALVEITD